MARPELDPLRMRQARHGDDPVCLAAHTDRPHELVETSRRMDRDDVSRTGDLSDVAEYLIRVGPLGYDVERGWNHHDR